jgi:hypothetical protein
MTGFSQKMQIFAPSLAEMMRNETTATCSRSLRDNDSRRIFQPDLTDRKETIMKSNVTTLRPNQFRNPELAEFAALRLDQPITASGCRTPGPAATSCAAASGRRMPCNCAATITLPCHAIRASSMPWSTASGATATAC